jgi:NitT/TauT family transport system permease protein
MSQAGLNHYVTAQKTQRINWISSLGARFADARVTIAFIVLCILLWEAIVRLFHVPLYIMPPPSRVIFQFFRNLPLIAEYTLWTGGETLAGYIVSLLIAIPISMLIAFSKLLRQTLYPIAVGLEMVPKIAFAPLFVTWFGFGYAPKIIIVFLVCFFPIILSGILAFTSLSPELGYFARSTGADFRTMFWKIRLPAALPQLFVGIKGAALNATVGATISEWIGGDAGLGYYLQIASGDLRVDLAFAIIFMLASLGLVLFYTVMAIERRIIPWHVSQRMPVVGQTL